MKYAIAILLLLNAIVATATVYMHLDKNGNPVYTDTPNNTTSVKVEDGHDDASTFNTSPSTSTAPASTPATSTNPLPEANLTSPQPAPAPVENQAKMPYNALIIQTPADHATIQNQPSIDVEVKTDPGLQPGDKIQMYLDNVPYGSPSQSTKLSLPRMERGTHQLSAAILDQNKTILKQSAAVTIYVHQTSPLNTPAINN